jgi:flagellar hook-associated protein 3 FlgL
MDQISTSSSYGSLLTSLMAGEARQSQIGAQISSGQTASDLEGYGANAETLTALQATNTQVSGYITQTQVVGAQLSVQDQALQEVAGAGSGAREAIANVVAGGDGSTLMQSLQTFYQTATAGLNATYNGQYLFSGGLPNTQPVNSSNINDLATTPVASLFQNGQLVTTTQLGPNSSIQTGVLASQVGTPLFTALQNIVNYAQANGPFNGQLTTAQTSFLTSQLSALDTVNTGLTNVVAQNGVAQGQVDDAQTSLTSQQTMLGGLMSNLTSADMATAATNLQQAQLSIQASEEVLMSLKQSSLLNFLSPTGAA